MTVTKTDITANKPATNQLTQVSAGDTVTAEIENANNLLLLQAVILAYNWIIDSGVELNATNIFTAAQQFAAGLKTYQIDPLNPNGDILINSGTGNVYQNSISALTKYMTYQEITALIAAVSGVTDGDKGDITISGGANIFTIDNSAVTTAKIADSNVTEIKLATDSVTTNKIANLNVTEGKLANNAVTTNKIANGTITANKLGFTVAGTLVKNTQASLGSDSVVTATTATASGLAIAYVPITSTNDRYIYGEIDWNVNDPDGSTAEGFIELQYSTDNTTWSTLDTFTRSISLGAGSKEVKITEATLGSDSTTTSTTYQASGLSIAYTPVNGANIRYVDFAVDTETLDNDSITSNQVQLQYSTDNSTWSALKTYTNKQGISGATNQYQELIFSDSYRHNASTSTPYYRIAHRSNPTTGGGTSYVYTNSTLRVREVEEQFVVNNRSPVTFLFKHNANTTTPYYRVAHRVTSGDQSTIYTGSVLRVMEFSL